MDASICETQTDSPKKPTWTIELLNKDGTIKTLAEVEHEAILIVLEYFGDSPNMSEAAKSLGIGRSTLYRKMNASEHNISRLK